MVDHNGVLTMQRLLLAGTLGLSMARKAAAILEGEPDSGVSLPRQSQEPQQPQQQPQLSQEPQQRPQQPPLAPLTPGPGPDGQGAEDRRLPEGVVLRAILDAANECLGHFDDRPPGERWCDALYHLLDLAAFAADLDSA
jgi:hypothetical protein